MATTKVFQRGNRRIARSLRDYLAGTRSPFEVGKDLFGRYASGRRDLATRRRELYAQVTEMKRRARE